MAVKREAEERRQLKRRQCAQNQTSATVQAEELVAREQEVDIWH